MKVNDVNFLCEQPLLRGTSTGWLAALRSATRSFPHEAYTCEAVSKVQTSALADHAYGVIHMVRP